MGYPKRSSWIKDEILSQLVADLCDLMGMQKVWTSPYHLQTNGLCERLNSTLINMLGTLPKKKESEWKNHNGTLVHAYNCIWNSATGFNPYFLMFGRQPCLPIDITLGLAPCMITEPNMSKFVQKSGSTPSGLSRRLRHFRPKKCNDTNETMISEVGQWPWRLGMWF